MRQSLLRGFLLILLCLPLIAPFLNKGYPKTQDGIWAVIRLVEMRREIKDLQFPPRWSGFLNHGYGYPLFLFTYPFPYYVGQLLYLPGISAETAIKILFILTTVLSGLTMYLFAKNLWGINSALLSTTLYLYAPYRLTNLFTRGSLGELFAFIFYPLLFFLFKKLIEKPAINKGLVTSIVLSGLILSHNASVVLFLPFLGLWIVYLLFQNQPNVRKNIKLIISTFLLAFLLSAYFWLPAILDKKYIILGWLPLADKSLHFLPWSVLFGNSLHIVSGLLLKIGLIHLIIVLVSLISVFVSFFKKQRILVVFFLLMFVISIFLTQPQSLFLWKLPIFKEIDFPWRILGISTFLISVIGGSLVNFKKGYFLAIPLIILVVMFNISQIKTEYVNNDPSFYDTNDASTTSNDELMPIWVKNKPKNRYTEKIEIPLNNGNYKILTDKSNILTFEVDLKENSLVKINTLYFFPLWQAFEDNIKIPIFPEENTGRMMLNLNSGKHNIRIDFFKGASNENIANILSIVGVICFISIWVYSKKYYRG